MKREREAKDREDRISALRSTLSEKSRRIGKETKVESRKIIAFLEMVFSEDESQRTQASARLRQAAGIASDLFPETAIELILELGATEDFAELILPVCVELAGRRDDLGTLLETTALNNIERGIRPEESAAILDRLDHAVAYPLDESCLEMLLLAQNHHRWIVTDHPSVLDYSHSTNVLIRSLDTEPDSLLSVVRGHLQNEDEDVRVNLCGAIQLVQNERPHWVLSLCDDLMHSLEMHEDAERMTTPSSKIVKIFEAAFRHSPQAVDRFLAKSMTRVRAAVQEDITRIYRNQFFDWTARSQGLPQSQKADISEADRIAINRLWAWAKDEQLEIDIRGEGIEALELPCKYSPDAILEHFDALLGYFALVCSVEKPPKGTPKILLPNKPHDQQLEHLEEFNRKQQWRFFKQRLRQCIKAMCEARPKETVDSVLGCLEQPSGELEEAFKACCVYLLGVLGKDYRLRPRVLPALWQALMDYASAWVRAEAIDATVELFSHSKGSPPGNLVDVLIVHLRDPMVIVHRAALRAVSWRPSWFDARQSVEVLDCLQVHLHAYRGEPYQIDDICEAILAISRRVEQCEGVALRLVESVFPTGEALVDSKIAEELIRFCRPDEKFAPRVAKIIGETLGRQERDRYNTYSYSRRQRMFEWLHSMSPRGFESAREHLLVSAKELAQRDFWESCHFASLFSRFRAFNYEQDVLKTATKALPAEPKYELVRRDLNQLAANASGNALLQCDDIPAAESCFRDLVGKG